VSGAAHPREFSVEEAERTLPLVRRITEDIVTANARLSRLLPELRRARLRVRGAFADAPSPDELDRLRTQVARLSGRLEGYLRELSQVGCELHDVDGLVDFRSRIDGEPVRLCWRLGEDGIRWWHPARAEAGSRRPLPAAALQPASTGRDGDG
jgi:hypothetical protein